MVHGAPYLLLNGWRGGSGGQGIHLGSWEIHTFGGCSLTLGPQHELDTGKRVVGHLCMDGGLFAR